MHSSNVSFHSLAPLSSIGRASCDGHGICAGDDVTERELDRISRSPHRLSRAQSEGDLACVSAAMGAVVCEHHGLSLPRRVSRGPSHSPTSSLDMTKSIPEEIDEPEQSPAHTRSLLHTASYNGNDAILDPNFGHQFVLNDGEVYSSIEITPSGSPLACNGKGCRPLTPSECKKLGFLDMASGVGVASYVWNERDKGTATHSSNRREAYYQSLLQSDPENPLLLRNYAKFLSKKGDVKKSEEYYERAILVDPNDGEVLSQYAKLQWDVHRDQDRAETYYGQAVQAAPDDCYVMASYASFLWDAEDTEEESPATPPVPAYGSPALVSSPLLASA